MIVVDASALFGALAAGADAPELVDRVLLRGGRLHAPHVIDLEIVQTLRRFEAHGHVTPSRARQVLDDLHELPLHRHGHDVLAARIWELRSNLTAYDAAYVALAEGLDATLVTRDGRLASAPGHRARVELV